MGGRGSIYQLILLDFGILRAKKERNWKYWMEGGGGRKVEQRGSWLYY